MSDLSNSLADLAERIRLANDAVVVAERTTAEKAIEAGRLLCEAKDACAHGEWTPFLARAGVHDRQARRLMQLARSGLNIGHVSELGGIKSALEYLADRQLPAMGEYLVVSREREATDKSCALISPALSHDGYFDVTILGMSGEGGGEVTKLDRPILGESRLIKGVYVNGLWAYVDAHLSIPLAERVFAIAPIELLIPDEFDLLPEPGASDERIAGTVIMPRSYLAAHEALDLALNEPSPEHASAAANAMRVFMVKMDSWPDHKAMIPVYGKIAGDNGLSNKAARLALIMDAASEVSP